MTEADSQLDPAAQQEKPIRLARILVPTDFSEPSDCALSYAVALAGRFDAHIFLMHVLTAVDDLGRMEHSSPEYQAQRQAAERAIEKILASQRLRGVPHEVLLEEGYLWPTIERFVQTTETDLIAVGTHGAPSRDHQFLGSSAELIFRHVDCPVLTTGPACRQAAPPGSKADDFAAIPFSRGRILLATDFGRAAEHATRYGVALAQAFGARLTLLHVINAVPSNPEENAILRETARIRLIEAVPEDVAPRLNMTTQVEFGDAPEQILKAARDGRAELIVMGARAGTTLMTHHLPETSAYTVAAASPCPLITVRR